MFRNFSCPSCKCVNQVNNIEKYLGKKARIYCLNTACNREIIVDLTQEELNPDETQVIKPILNIESEAYLTYSNLQIVSEKLKLFKGENVIGRTSISSLRVDLQIKGDPYVSRRQFLIKHGEDGFIITDGNGKNKTLLNGKVLEPGQEVYLINKDQISVGQTILIFNLL